MTAAGDRCPHCRRPLLEHPYVCVRTGQPASLIVCEACDSLALWPVLRGTTSRP